MIKNLDLNDSLLDKKDLGEIVQLFLISFSILSCK